MNSLRSLRTRRGMSQIELAKRIGISNQLISAAEIDISALPPRHFLKIARILKASPELFICDALLRYEKMLRAKMRPKRKIVS